MRVDAQVVDRGNRTITGLRVSDFILREEGRPQEIRNFASENMPVDVLLLLDVSPSVTTVSDDIPEDGSAPEKPATRLDRVIFRLPDVQTVAMSRHRIAAHCGNCNSCITAWKRGSLRKRSISGGLRKIQPIAWDIIYRRRAVQSLRLPAPPHGESDGRPLQATRGCVASAPTDGAKGPCDRRLLAYCLSNTVSADV